MLRASGARVYERAPTLGGGFARAHTMAIAFNMSKGLSLSCPLLCLCASDLKAPVLLKATFRKPTLLGRPDFAVPHYLGILSFGGSRVIHEVVSAPKAEPSQFIVRTQNLLPLLLLSHQLPTEIAALQRRRTFPALTSQT